MDPSRKGFPLLAQKQKEERRWGSSVRNADRGVAGGNKINRAGSVMALPRHFSPFIARSVKVEVGCSPARDRCCVVVGIPHPEHAHTMWLSSMGSCRWCHILMHVYVSVECPSVYLVVGSCLLNYFRFVTAFLKVVYVKLKKSLRSKNTKNKFCLGKYF